MKEFKKLKKHHFVIISIQTGMRLAEKEKKKIVPNTVPTRPELENSKKKNSKKIQKIKKHHSGIISTETGTR